MKVLYLHCCGWWMCGNWFCSFAPSSFSLDSKFCISLLNLPCVPAEKLKIIGIRNQTPGNPKPKTATKNWEPGASDCGTGTPLNLFQVLSFCRKSMHKSPNRTYLSIPWHRLPEVFLHIMKSLNPQINFAPASFCVADTLLKCWSTRVRG